MAIKKNSTRLIINTGAQYLRTLINLVLSLYSTRLILDALGVRDYGVFTLIAGVVSMLSFMTNAMVSTTQRFLSYHQTKSDLNTQRAIFGNSVLMHLFFSIGVLILLEIVGLYLFDGFLNISSERIPAAKVVYQCAICMILLSFISAPFRALLISHENLVYISVVDILDGVIKVGIAILISVTNSDKLILYGYLMMGINFLNLGAFSIYDFRNYKECVLPDVKSFNIVYLKDMSSFVGWQLYNTGCVIGRTQGVAIVLNKFFGSLVNAAYGIALQISGSVNFVSTALVTAINPQIVKAEGSGNRNRMFQLAESASKFSCLLLAAVVVPVFFCLPDLLLFWLGRVPEGSVIFCRVILVSALVDQSTYGLNSANQAIGNIKGYALYINTIKLLTVPTLIILLMLKVPLSTAIWAYAVFEMICAGLRVFYVSKTGGLNFRRFISNTLLKLPIPIGFIILTYSVFNLIGIKFFVFILLILPVTIIYFLTMYAFSMSCEEKMIVKKGFKKSLSRLHRCP